MSDETPHLASFVILYILRKQMKSRKNDINSFSLMARTSKMIFEGDFGVIAQGNM